MVAEPPSRAAAGPHRALGILVQAAKGWMDDDAASRGAALAYYAVFSIAPILVLAISIAGILYGEDTARAEVSARLHELLGAQGAGAVDGLLARALPRGSGVFSTLVGIGTLLVGATTLFHELRSAFDRVWKVPPRQTSGLKSFLCRQGLGLLMVLLTGALLLLSLVLGTLSSLAEQFLHDTVRDLPIALPVGTFALVTLAFATMFKVLPDTKVEWRDVWVGALVSAGLFTLGRVGVGLYLEWGGIASAYGAAGSLVAFLVWVYWSAQILLFGAELTRACALARVKPTPA